MCAQKPFEFIKRNWIKEENYSKNFTDQRPWDDKVYILIHLIRIDLICIIRPNDLCAMHPSYTI